MSEFTRGDIVHVNFMSSQYATAIVVGTRSNSDVCLNWITQESRGWYFGHEDPDCDAWISPCYLVKIGHANHI